MRRSVWLIALSAAALGGCINGEASEPPVVPGGDAARGKELVFAYACGSCHVIPGVAAAENWVGPPLTDWVERKYIAGTLWNTPENLVRWIMNPQAIEPGTAMPDMGVEENEARDMAAYLYTLGDTHPLGPPHPFPVEWLHNLGTGSKKKKNPGAYAVP